MAQIHSRQTNFSRRFRAFFDAGNAAVPQVKNARAARGIKK
jgi:hypothetical protein